MSEATQRPRFGTVFLDRDGTINRKPAEGHYVTHKDGLVLLPDAGEGLRRLHKAGVRVIVVTNQRGISLGLMSEEDLTAVHSRLLTEVAAAGGAIDGIYHCPHEIGQCDCRKPGTGLLERAAADFPDIDFSDSVIVGDSPSDIEAGRKLGVSTVLIAPPESDVAASTGADHIFSSLLTASCWITGSQPESL